MPLPHPPQTTAGPLSRKRGTAVLVLADGTVFEGHGFGAATSAVGEVCFNTAMTGYQEILTDPSYAGQIVAFTFPHIGIVGTNAEDVESTTPVVRAMVVRADAAGALQLPQHGNAEPLAGAQEYSRHCRARHPRADGLHPQTGHAAWRRRA